MVSNYKGTELFTNYGNACALIDEDSELTYSELFETSKAISETMKSRTVVLIIATNTIECVVGYVGFISKGIVPLMVSSSAKEDDLYRLIEEYRPEYIWHNLHMCFEGRTVKTYRTYQLVETECANEESLHPELAMLLTTSGSTGSQKYVRLSYKNIESNALSIADYLNIDATDRAITTLPLSYSYGLSIINSHLITGASLIMTDRSLFDRTFWTLLKENKATNFGGVPYTYEMLKRLRFNRMDLPSLRSITQAGGRLGESLHREFASICCEKNIDFVVMYGQTEATARLTYLPPQYALKKAGFIGIPIPGGTIELIDNGGAEIREAGVSGELVYSGPNVSMGYAEGRKDLSLGDERGGRLETGDIAVRDDEGFYRIVGRKKRFLKVFGNRVNLDEVECMLAKEGYVAACVGEDDHMTIYVEEPIQDASSVQAFLSEKLNVYKGAFAVKRIDVLPRNDAGKLLYATLEERENA